MALIGNCTHTVISDHPTETVQEKATEYNENGEEISVYTAPLQVVNTNSYENIYLVITQIDNRNEIVTNDGVTTWKKFFEYRYSAYENQTARNNDPDTNLFYGVGSLENYNHTGSLYEQVYNDIKAKDGLTNLTQD